MTAKSEKVRENWPGDYPDTLRDAGNAVVRKWQAAGSKPEDLHDAIRSLYQPLAQVYPEFTKLDIVPRDATGAQKRAYEQSANSKFKTAENLFVSCQYRLAHPQPTG